MQQKYKFSSISTFLFLAFCLFFAKATSAQQTPFESEAVRFKAQTNRDTLALKNLLANELSYCHSNGLLESKQDFIKSINSGKIIYDSITIIEHSGPSPSRSPITSRSNRIAAIRSARRWWVTPTRPRRMPSRRGIDENQHVFIQRSAPVQIGRASCRERV